MKTHLTLTNTSNSQVSHSPKFKHKQLNIIIQVIKSLDITKKNYSWVFCPFFKPNVEKVGLIDNRFLGRIV